MPNKCGERWYNVSSQPDILYNACEAACLEDRDEGFHPCRLLTKVNQAEIKMDRLYYDARRIRAYALDVKINEGSGKLLLDTGASGADRVNGVPFAHAGGGPGGADIARPAEFLIDSTGTVRWVNLTDSILVRARPEQILKEVDGLGLATPRGK